LTARSFLSSDWQGDRHACRACASGDPHLDPRRQMDQHGPQL